MTPPRILSIAGSDPSGGAGLQADLKTCAALGAYGMSVVTALTAQNTTGVSGVHAVRAEFVAAQLAAISADCPPQATKTGMLFSADIVGVVVEWATCGRASRLVVDPVMVATSGDRLLCADAEAALREHLIPLADVVTPNRAEAGVLAGGDVSTADDAVSAARALIERGARAALVTGGDSGGTESVDVLVEADGSVTRLSLPRLAVGPAHGTGCTLSAAIAVGLAEGRPLVDAVRRAKRFVHRGLATAFAVGAGAVPVNHLAAGRSFGAGKSGSGDEEEQ